MTPRYQQILDQLAQEIGEGRYAPGQKFPSEADLVRRFGASRITVGRAVRELQTRGLLHRIAGSGTFVRAPGAAAQQPLQFGLIIPNLGHTDIFEPICQGIARAPEAQSHALLWGGGSELATGKQLLDVCQQYIRRAVSGVFFAPAEMIEDAPAMNGRVLATLAEAGIPVVLLDRRPDPLAAKNRTDLVGIDNWRAGFLAADHLLRTGARRLAFLSFEHQAATVHQRLVGFRDALRAHDLTPAAEIVAPVPHDETLDLPWRPGAIDGFVCSNDRIAGHLMHTLLGQNVRIPEDVCIVGIDDVAYASLLPVPLTTVHQPCRAIGETALRVMLERIERPTAPARDVLLDCWLVVRRSCGSANAAK